MEFPIPLLSTITFIPMIVALAMPLLVQHDDVDGQRNAKGLALIATSFTFLLSLLLWIMFDAGDPGFQFVEETSWLGQGIAYRMGVDGISLFFVLLTTFLMPICILASWDTIKTNVRAYMMAFLILETLMIGVFSALDLVLFYLFFEGSLIPMFIIIGVWGGKRRIYASFKFFLYTFVGSVLMLLAMMAMYWDAGTTDIRALLAHEFTADMQFWLWIAFFASFAVKMPMWPVHTWLPDAHVEAPTAGSVILAAILLKMGGYGFLRFSLPMFPEASLDLASFVYVLSIIAVIYTSLVALMQEDMKKLIAYSSVAHMGFVTLGIFTATVQGVHGALFLMISHGLVSGALFLCVGVIYDRMHTREIAAYGGLVRQMPLYAVVFMIFTMANVGLPGTSGFVGEFLVLLGAFDASTWAAGLATTGLVLSAGYALWLYRRVVLGPLEKESLRALPDLSRRELATPGAARCPNHLLRRLPLAYPRSDERRRREPRRAGRRRRGGARGRRADSRQPFRGSALMTFVSPALMPVLPELVLGLGAMLLLLLGAFRGDRAFDTCVGLAIALLLGAVVLIYFIPDGRITTFGRRPRDRS